MKKWILLGWCFWIPVILAAQIALPVEDTRRQMSKGEQPGFLLRIPEANVSGSERAWMREIRKGSRSRPSKSKEEISMEGAVLSAIRADAMNVYARFYQDGRDVLLYAFFEIDSVFFDGSTQQDLAGNIRQYLRDFGINQYREGYAKLVRAEERVLRNLERDNQSLASTNNKSQRDISRNERRISDLNQRIKEIAADEDRKSAEIERQKSLIETLRDFPEEQKAARSQLKSFERERRKMKRSRESAHKSIERFDGQIKRSQRNIRINEEMMRQKSSEIENLQNKVKEMKTRLSGIQ